MSVKSASGTLKKLDDSNFITWQINLLDYSAQYPECRKILMTKEEPNDIMPTYPAFVEGTPTHEYARLVHVYTEEYKAYNKRIENITEGTAKLIATIFSEGVGIDSSTYAKLRQDPPFMENHQKNPPLLSVMITRMAAVLALQSQLHVDQQYAKHIALKQGDLSLQEFANVFDESRETLKLFGRTIEDSVAMTQFVDALDQRVFVVPIREIKRHIDRDPYTLAQARAHLVTYYDFEHAEMMSGRESVLTKRPASRITPEPSSKRGSGDEVIIGALADMDIQTPAESTRKKCLLCNLVGHTTDECFSFLWNLHKIRLFIRQNPCPREKRGQIAEPYDNTPTSYKRRGPFYSKMSSYGPKSAMHAVSHDQSLAAMAQQQAQWQMQAQTHPTPVAFSASVAPPFYGPYPPPTYYGPSAFHGQMLTAELDHREAYPTWIGSPIAMSASVGMEDEILLDSGCTDTMFRDKKFLTEIKDSPPQEVRGLSHKISCKHRGIFEPLGDAYLVPDATANLVSLGQLLRDQFTVVLKGHTFYIFNRNCGPLLATATLNERGLFPVKLEKSAVSLGFNKLNCSATRVIVEAESNVKVAFRASIIVRPEPAPQFNVIERERARQARMLHVALAHPGNEALITLVKHSAIRGIALTPADISNMNVIYGACIQCAQGKQHNIVNSHSIGANPSSVGDRIFADIFITEGRRHALLSRDEYSGHIMFISLANKQANTVAGALTIIISHYKKFQHNVSHILCDDEETFRSCAPVINSQGVRLACTPPGDHNGRVERTGRILRERYRAIIHGLPYILPDTLIMEAYSFIVKALNLTPNGASGRVAPRTLVVREVYDVSSHHLGPLSEFGIPVLTAHPSNQILSKSESHADIGLLLSRDLLAPTCFRVFLPLTSQVVHRKIVKTLPHIPDCWNLQANPSYQSIDRQAERNLTQSDDVAQVSASQNDGHDEDPPSPAISQRTEDTADADVNSDNIEAPMPMQRHSHRHVRFDTSLLKDTRSKRKMNDNYHLPLSQSHPSESEDDDTVDDEGAESSCAEPTTNSQEARRRSNRAVRSNNKYTDFITTSNPASRKASAQLAILSYRVHIKEALTSSYADHAKVAIKAEFDAMHDLKVWTYVKFGDIPESHQKNILPSLIFLKEKYKADGSFDKIKARLAAGGHLQREGSYVDTSSPCVSTWSVMFLLAVSSFIQAHIIAADVPTAYLHTPLTDATIYMKIPKDSLSIWKDLYQDRNRMISPDGNVYVKLEKALYGLKQSSYLWYNKLSNTLKNIGYHTISADTCVFVKGSGINATLIALYVDDLLIISKSEVEHDLITRTIASEFGTPKVQYPPISYLNMHIEVSSDRSKIRLTQKGYLNGIIDKYQLQDTCDSIVPSSNDLFDQKEDSTPYNNPSRYLSLLMSLMYLAQRTRPDILKECAFLSTRSNKPSTDDYRKLLKVVSYLRTTSERGITFKTSEMRIMASADSSFCVHKDGKSHTGINLFVGPNNAAIASKSAKQKLVTHSSTEAELVALDEVVTYVEWLRLFSREIGFEQLEPSVVQQDNMSTIYIANNGPGSFFKSKHINLRSFYCYDHIEKGTVTLTYVPTDQISADLLTKPTFGALFKKQRQSITNDV